MSFFLPKAKNQPCSKRLEIIIYNHDSRLGKVQIPTRIPEKFVVALFSGVLVNSGIVVVAGISRLH